MNESSYSDEAIVQKVQQGDTEAFGLLVERYEQKIKRYARRFLFAAHDAEDLTQEVFLKAYVNIQSFDAARRFSPWLYRIAHNEFINAIKKRRNEPVPFFDPDTLFPHPVAAERPDREMDQRELKTLLDRCLNELGPKYREPLILYYFEELSYQEIAEVLHLPASTVGVRISRGKETMRSILSSSHEAYEPNHAPIN
jgi:RNA polymerase sigma-70 factor, ECF subfamily